MFKKVLLLFCLLVALSSTVWAEEADSRYYYCYKDTTGSYYFDTKTIRFIPTDTSSKDIVDVWIKISYSEEGKKNYLATLKNAEAYKDLAFSLHHYQIRFSTNECRGLGNSYLTSKGLINYYVLDNPKWEPIPPESPGEALLDGIKRYLNAQEKDVDSN